MIHVITAAHNRQNITERFAVSLKKQSYQTIHLILVDDGSTDRTAEVVKEILPRTTVIHGDGSLWWGGALHEAYKWVHKHLKNKPEDYIFITNDDVQYPPDYVKKGIDCLNKRKTGMVHGEGYDIETKELLDTLYHVDYNRPWNETVFYRSEDQTGECCSTRSLFMTVGTFLHVGGFHPFLLPHYGSDTEWTMRAARKGHRIYAFDELRYEMNHTSIGAEPLDTIRLKKLFSKHSNANPYYRMNSLILSTPIKYMPRELVRQFMRYIKKTGIIRKR